MGEYRIDIEWFPRPEWEADDHFVAVHQAWLKRLAEIDERFGWLGRDTVRKAERAYALPLDTLKRSYVRQYRRLGVNSIRGPLDKSLGISIGPSRLLPAIDGRTYISMRNRIACETGLMMQIIESAILMLTPDEVRMVGPSKRYRELPVDEQRGPPNRANVRLWLRWQKDVTAPDIGRQYDIRGEPTRIEAWMGGMLSTWDENEPNRLLAEMGADLED
jgi:hypothetical protein